jgi:hypothetical protein
MTGINGDAGASDGVYTLRFTTTESAAGEYEVQCTAASKGLLQRIKSPPATITVVPGTGSGAISAPAISPASIALGVATAVTITAAVTGGAPDEGSIMLQRLDSSGRVLALLGTLHDDGLNGDAVASDGTFTLRTMFTEFAVEPVSLRVAATSSSAVNHVFSSVGTLTVTGAPPPTVIIKSPTNPIYLNLSPTTVTGVP